MNKESFFHVQTVAFKAPNGFEGVHREAQKLGEDFHLVRAGKALNKDNVDRHVDFQLVRFKIQ